MRHAHTASIVPGFRESHGCCIGGPHQLDGREGEVVETVDPSKLAVIVLNWNCAPDTVAAVRSLPDSWHERTFVIDNGSDDWPEVERLLASTGVRRVHHRPVNGGYAAGMNTGLRLAAPDYTHAVLVNADALPSEAALLRMLDLANEFAVVGIAQTRGTGVRATEERYTTAAVGSGLTPKAFSCSGCEIGFHAVDVVSGAVILVDIGALASVGFMDEDFFHYKEEVDLAYRVRSAGGRIAWVCDISVPHAVGASLPHSSPSSTYYRARNEVLFFIKHLGRVRAALNPRLLRNELTFFLAAARLGHTRAWASGVAHGFAGRSGRRRTTSP